MNPSPAQALIKLENVTKVFHTDEVETHALAGIQMDIQKGEYVSISGPSGCRVLFDGCGETIPNRRL